VPPRQALAMLKQFYFCFVPVVTMLE